MSQYPCNEFSISHLVLLIQGLLKNEQESYSKIFKLFCVNEYAETKIKFSAAMPYNKLPTNFQLNIFTLG